MLTFRWCSDNCILKNTVLFKLRIYLILEYAAYKLCFFLKGKTSINPLNKLYYLASSTDLFCTSPKKQKTKKKHILDEQHETRLLLKSHYSYRNVFYSVKTWNLSRNSNIRELNGKKLQLTKTLIIVLLSGITWYE